MNGKAYEYAFSLGEIKQLVLILRQQEKVLPHELRRLFSFLESSVYDTMTIEEAESFFNGT